MEKPVTIKLAVLVFAGYLLTCSITTAKDVLNGRVVPPSVEQTSKAFTEEQWKIIYQLFQRYSSNVNIVNGEFEEWLRNVGAEIDTARDTAGTALAATWPWSDSSGRGPYWVDSAGYADTAGRALDADTSGAELNAALALRNNVDADSTWERAKVYNSVGDDSVVIVPAYITVYGNGDMQLNLVHTIGEDSCLFTVNAAGVLSIDPSGSSGGIDGSWDVVGTLEADSADIDGGVDISGWLRGGTGAIINGTHTVYSSAIPYIYSSDNAAHTNYINMYYNATDDHGHIDSPDAIKIDAGAGTTEDSLYLDDHVIISLNLQVSNGRIYLGPAGSSRWEIRGESNRLAFYFADTLRGAVNWSGDYDSLYIH